MVSALMIASLFGGMLAVPHTAVYAQPTVNDGAGGSGNNANARGTSPAPAPAPVRPNAPGATPTNQTNGPAPTGSGDALGSVGSAARAASMATPGGAAGAAIGAVAANSLINIFGEGGTWDCMQLSPSCVKKAVGVVVETIFSAITYFLSKMLILLTGVLIVFARYDKFNQAVPVSIGWTIVRDLMNVMFVIALLVSAFATITGYGKKQGLHYTDALPKIFLGAILVNFSRTLMLLMIDASQVVMLTFISAFEGTIAGNVFQAFGLTKLQNFQSQGEGPGITAMILGYFLAVGLLMTAVTIVLCYVLYFVGRIVGLWFLIIISPIYFAAEMLPSKFGTSISKMSDDVSSKITALLVGGPKVAFFLWIAFATVQQTASTPDRAAELGFDVPEGLVGGTIGFITQIGTVQEITGFIVASVMLGIGLKTVESSAKEVGMGDLVGTIKKHTSEWQTKLQRAPWTLAKNGASYANRRLGLTNQLAQGMARGANGLPSGGGALRSIGAGAGSLLSQVPGLGGVAAGAAAAAVGGVAAKAVAENRKQAKARIESLKDLSTSDQVAAIRRMNQDGLASREQLEANHEALMDAGRRKEYQKQLEAEEKQRRLADLPTNLTDAQRKEVDAEAKAAAAERLRNDEAQRLKGLHDLGVRAADAEAVEKVEKQREKSMLYARDAEGDAAYNKQVKSALEDPKKFGEMDAEALKEGRLAVQMLREKGAIITNADGTMRVDDARYNAVFEMVKDNKELSATLEESKRMINGGASVDDVARARRSKDAYGADRFFGAVSREQPDGSKRVEFAAVMTRNETTALNSLRSAAVQDREADGSYNSAQRQVFRDAMQAGVPFAQIKSILDISDRDAQAVNELSSYAASIMADTDKDLEKRLKEVGEIARIAKKEGTTEQQASIYLNSMPADIEDMKRLMWRVSNMSTDRQKDFSNLVSLGSVAENSNDAIAQHMKSIREKITSQKSVTFEVSTPAVDDDGRPVTNPDGTQQIHEEDVKWEVPSAQRKMFSPD